MDSPVQTGIAISISVLGFLLLLIVVLLCICKQQRARRRAANVTKDDENATYGDYYCDTDARMEVEDSNAYYSSDYEAGTGTSRTMDNNPCYE